MGDILTPFQIHALRLLGREPLLRDFYLTGGTALSAFYLKHRYSDDLDFFTQTPGAVARVPPIVRKIARRLGARIVFGRRFQTLFECALIHPRYKRLEMDFALDMPGRLKPVRKTLETAGVRLDNLLDIACNKLSALSERAEPKDFVDVYRIDQTHMPLRKLIIQARRKYRELDDYCLAMSFFKVKGVTLLPRMIDPLSLTALRSFFLWHAERLARRITKKS